jgi:hypothetical protein
MEEQGKHTALTLQECKDEVARRYVRYGITRYESWEDMEMKTITDHGGIERLLKRADEAAELYASKLSERVKELEERLRSELPSWYTPVEEPAYLGRGLYSVNVLEEICEQFKEYSHQSGVRLANLRQINDALTSENQKLRSIAKEVWDIGAPSDNLLYYERWEKVSQEISSLLNPEKK